MNFSASSILLALISTTIIFCGCSKKEQVETPEVRVVARGKIQYRNGIYYEVNQTTPFTGLIQQYYPDGQKSLKSNVKEGKNHGVHISWHENGQKEVDATYKNGKEQGVFTMWHENGQKEFEVSYKDGKEQGAETWWYVNGQKERETNYKDGKKQGMTQWDENGKKTSETRYKDDVIQN